MKCVTRALDARSQSRRRSSTRCAIAPRRPVAEAARSEVLVAQVPRVAHRRVAVADVQLAGAVRTPLATACELDITRS